MYVQQLGNVLNAEADMIKERANKYQKRADDKSLKAALGETDEEKMEAARRAQNLANSSRACT